MYLVLTTKNAVTTLNNAYVMFSVTKNVAHLKFSPFFVRLLSRDQKLCVLPMADRATAVYSAQHKDDDDDSTLLGSSLISVRSMECSSFEGGGEGGGGSMSCDSSLASSLFQGDLYFSKEPDTPPYAPPDWDSLAKENSNEKRGREFAKKLLQKSTKRRTKSAALFSPGTFSLSPQSQKEGQR